MNKLALQLEKAAEIRALIGEDNPDLLHDMVEGETDLFEIMDWLLDKEAQESIMQEAIAERISKLSARADSCKGRKQRLRDALLLCMRVSGQRSLRRPEATLSLKEVASSISTIDEAALPEAFWKTTRSVSRSAINEAIAQGKAVDGVTMSNGTETLAVRR